MSASPEQPENPSCCTNCASPTVPSTASSARLAHAVSTCHPRTVGPAHQAGPQFHHCGILWNRGARVAGHPGPAPATPRAGKVLEPRAGGPKGATPQEEAEGRAPTRLSHGEGPRGWALSLPGPPPAPRPQRGAKAAHTVPTHTPPAEPRSQATPGERSSQGRRPGSAPHPCSPVQTLQERREPWGHPGRLGQGSGTQIPFFSVGDARLQSCRQAVTRAARTPAVAGPWPASE